MKIAITGRHLDVTEAINGYVTGQFERLRQHFQHLPLLDTHIILSVDRIIHKAEVDYHCDGSHLCCIGESEDLYKSVDEAFEKMERQLEKYMARRQRHHPTHKREERNHIHGIVVVPDEL